METAQQLFATCLRAIQVDLYADLRTTYCSQMGDEAARTLAAQVVNFLKGEDINEIARVSDERLRSQITAVLPQVERRAEERMQTDRHTREIIVATGRGPGAPGPDFGNREVCRKTSTSVNRIPILQHLCGEAA
jgi:hypothetical protein